jgi:hypothetical protein
MKTDVQKLQTAIKRCGRLAGELRKLKKIMNAEEKAAFFEAFELGVITKTELEKVL